MNKSLFISVLAVLFAASTSVFAQTSYNISDTNAPGQVDNTFQITCQNGTGSENNFAAYLYDSGGASGQYQTNESYIRDIASTNSGAISLKFTQFNLASGTVMTIKDGISQEILVSNATGTSLNGLTFTSNRGSLQIIWTSGSTRGAGFTAKIWCGDMCQTFRTTFTPSVSPTTEYNPATGLNDTYYDVCNGTAVSFTASTVFDNNHAVYDQDEGSLLYHWGIIDANNDTITPDGNALGMQTLTYTFTESGGYRVICTTEDDRHCLNRNVNARLVRVSLRPTWPAVSFGPDSICPGETVSLHGEPHVEPWVAIRPPVIAGATFLPDGNSTCYNTSLEFDFFGDDQRITSANDFERIYLNMEHSYLGDLSMVLQCPNGQMCLLHAYGSGTMSSLGWSLHGGTNITGSSGGGNIHLGHAPDPGTYSDCYYIQGEGYSYNFTPTSTTPFGPNGPTTRESYTDPCGNTESNDVLNEGDYGTYENLSSLVGCPLNGTWTIYVCDHLSADNGWIFEWGLYFNNSLYPDDTWRFTNTYTTSGYSWSGVGVTTGQNGSANATATVQNPDPDNWSEIPYTFSATDNFGCSYDTTVLVHVKPAHHSDCCIEPTPTVTASSTTPCGNTITLSAGSFAYPSNTGQWTYTGPGTATFTAPTQPQTDVTVNVYGDYTFTWHEYYMGNETCTGDASVNVNFARRMNATLASVGNCCRSGALIQLSAQDFGTLSCNPSSAALNLDARTFQPSLANPGRYTITNTITGERCADPATSSVTFDIYDEIVISNRTETCDDSDDAHPRVEVTFSVNGLNPGSNPPVYNVTGRYRENDDAMWGTPANGNITANDQTSNTFSFSQLSALDYALTVSDTSGCSSVSVAGYFACNCPYNAGTFASYAPHIMCTGETYNVGQEHSGGSHLQGTGTLSYIICTNPNYINTDTSYICTLSGNTTSVSLANIPNGREGRQYYLVAVCGNGEGLAVWGTGCRSVTQAVPLMWKASPTPTVTGAETCGLVIQLNGSEVPEGMNGYWTATPPDGVTGYNYTTIENTTNIMNNPRILSSHYGNVTFTWHIVNAECTGDASAIYNFRQIPSPEAGPDITVCGVSADITGANPTIPEIDGSSLQWTGSGVVMSDPSSIQPTANANAGGTYVLTLTERNGECAGSDNVTITFINPPAPATTANVDTVCGHTAELQVYNTNPANEGRWTAYNLNGQVLPSVIYHNYNNPLSPSSDRYPHCLVTVPIPDDVSEVEYEFRWSEPINDPRLTDGNCAGEAVKHVVFRKVPVASVHQCGSTGNHVAVCGREVELCADASASEGYVETVWMVKADDIAGRFADSSQINTTFTLDTSIHVTRYQDVDIYFVARNATCVTIDTMHVRFLEKPTANAGNDHAACGNSYLLNGSWSLQPEDGIYTPTCQWTVGQKPNPAAQVTWTNTPHDSIVEGVQVSDYGVYTFIVREINTMGDAATCFDRDTVTVEFMEVPNVQVPRDTLPVCGLDFQLHVTSSHQEGDNIEGTWTSETGGAATFTDRHDPNTTGHYSAYGLAGFRWTETNHPTIQSDNEETCSDSKVRWVHFYEIPSAVISMNEGDTAVCGLTYAYLRAENPGDEIRGFWYEVNPSTQFGPNNQTVDQTITDVTVSSYGRHDFYWIEYTGPQDNQRFCKDTAGPWTIEFLQQPSAQITDTSITFCDTVGRLHVDFNGVGVGRWSSNAASSTVTFDDRSDPNTLIHSRVWNSDNYQDPYFEVYWTVQNTEYCTDKDTVKVVFAVVPDDSIVVIPPKCFGGPAILTANDRSLDVYDWEFGNGNIDTTYTDPENIGSRAFVYWDDKQTSHVVGLTTTNRWGCVSNIGRAIIEEPYLPEYSYRIIGDTCALGRGGIEFLDTTGTFSFFWIDTTVGPTITNPNTGYAITDFHVYNLPAGTYTYRSDYRTFNDEFISSYQTYFNNDIWCHDFPEVEVGTIGMIEADIAVSADIALNSLVAPEARVTFVNSTNYDNVNIRVCEWHFGDGTIEKNCDELVEHIYTEPTEPGKCYEPFLIVMNRDIQECRDTAFVDPICVDKESSLEVPNIFSPNGDGINDYFQVKAESLDTFHGKILNRYGRVVYEWTDWENEDAGWDGRLNGSTKATPGVYYYIIDAVGLDGHPYNPEGALHLVR
ncbi:MAG: gliding motility-associated C-terminal domain-containing protein [Bacteroidales bacterium]|nr:gliding motility-associated C-terminal domain-containing protein [Bacteroidales bacterium]